MAGQLPLVPGSMEIFDGIIAEQCWLCLRHVFRILHSVYKGCNLCNVIRCVCYVDHPAVIPVAKIVWDKYICELQVTVFILGLCSFYYSLHDLFLHVFLVCILIY